LREKKVKAYSVYVNERGEAGLKRKQFQTLVEDRDYHASMLARKNREMKEYLARLHSNSVAK
jgi:hypothetical protein